MNEWVREAIKHGKVTQAALARLLTNELGRSVDRAAVNKMTRDGRKVKADEMLAISRLTGFPPPAAIAQELEDDLAPMIEVVGYVGAGAETIMFDSGQGPFDRVAAPEGSTEDTVAVEIRGDSLGSLFDRWLIFYDTIRLPPTADLLGRLCVCRLTDGRVLVKKLKRGSIENRYTLLSNYEPPIYDVPIEWAARVKQMSPR